MWTARAFILAMVGDMGSGAALVANSTVSAAF
jgi:hypothetical protein